MRVTTMGRYTCREAQSLGDLERCLALRDLCFVGPDAVTGSQRDGYDARCQHFMIEDIATQVLVCSFRVLILDTGKGIDRSYSAQFYDLGALSNVADPILELGRFCIHPDRTDPTILRLAWGHITALAVAQKVSLLMGCSSFSGTDWQLFQAAFSVLYRFHRAPDVYAPRVKGAQVVRFADLEPRLAGAELHAHDRQTVLLGQKQMPTLLRTYLTMGGWVSDHAVIDLDLGTTHVFTAVEVARIPQARLRALMAMSD